MTLNDVDLTEFYRFADENSLIVTHSFVSGLVDYIKLVFSNPKSKRMYTCYLRKCDFCSPSIHDISVQNIFNAIHKNFNLKGDI